MYTIYVVFKSFDGKREAFVERAKAEGIVDEIRKGNGCIRYDYYYSEKDPNEILLIEEWESKEHQQTAKEKIQEMIDRLNNQEYTRFWP